MASINSYADIIGDWIGLLEAVERNPDVQPSVEAERQSLTQALSDAQSLKARQDELTAQRQDMTQQLNAMLKQGKETAIRLRAVAKGKLGPRSERLVHFKVAPLRRRIRKAVVKKPGGELPGQEPGTSTPRP
ncbi:MAG TPA: hypothetical protein VF789_04190 [Thermoanaerobaculia bacterium]